MKSGIRLLAIDIDGTLLDTRFQLSETNRSAVCAAHNQGIEIVLVTGRRHSFARPIVERLGIDLILIASNGAILKSAAGQTLARQLLPREKARDVLGAAGSYRDAAVLFFDRDGPGQIVAERHDRPPGPVQGYFERNRNSLLQVARLEEALEDDDPIQVLFLGTVREMRELARKLETSACADAVSLARAEYPVRDFTLLDVLDHGCSKGAALAAWAAQQGLGREQVMAIGDNWNDREMLAFAGFPVLMANSDAGLKQMGWEVTASNDENGVAVAIQKYLLSS